MAALKKASWRAVVDARLPSAELLLHITWLQRGGTARPQPGPLPLPPPPAGRKPTVGTGVGHWAVTSSLACCQEVGIRPGGGYPAGYPEEWCSELPGYLQV